MPMVVLGNEKVVESTCALFFILQFLHRLMCIFPVPQFAGATAHSHAFFGEGKRPVKLDFVKCTGSEYILTDCEIEESGTTTTHMLDVGVKCQPGV